MQRRPPKYLALWHTVAHCGTLWHTVAHCGTLWHTVAHCGTLWHTATVGKSSCNNLIFSLGMLLQILFFSAQIGWQRRKSGRWGLSTSGLFEGCGRVILPVFFVQHATKAKLCMASKSPHSAPNDQASSAGHVGQALRGLSCHPHPGWYNCAYSSNPPAAIQWLRAVLESRCWTGAPPCQAA